jgi:glycosyltransferase involved in cell wall biosynthesis
MVERRLSVAWISFFPMEWLTDAPEPLRHLPKRHPAPWQRILVEELSQVPFLDLHIFAVRSQYPRDFRFKRNNATFYCVKLPRGMRTLSLFWWETFLLRRAVNALRPDLVHAWGTERGAALVASRLRFPTLVTMQGLLEWCLEHVEMGPFVRLEANLERISLRRASTVTVESRFAMDWLRTRYPHLRLRQVEHAPNWLFHHLERRPALKPLHFLFVGTMCRLKGTDLLLLALDKLAQELDFRLTIVSGEAPEFAAHLQTIGSSALWDRVTILSNLTQVQVAEQMASATIMLFPTRVDNSPNSVKEAVVCGLPVVASGVGGIVDYVFPDLNGVIFEAGNLDQFISAIKAAVAHPLFRKGMVDPRVLNQMRTYLSPATMAEGFLDAYRSVVECTCPEKR